MFYQRGNVSKRKCDKEIFQESKIFVRKGVATRSRKSIEKASPSLKAGPGRYPVQDRKRSKVPEKETALRKQGDVMSTQREQRRNDRPGKNFRGQENP